MNVIVAPGAPYFSRDGINHQIPGVGCIRFDKCTAEHVLLAHVVINGNFEVLGIIAADGHIIKKRRQFQFIESADT